MKSSLVLGVVVLLFGSACAQTVDLTPAAGTAAEGTSINVVCTINGGTPDESDIECGLGLATSTTAENTYDFADISCYTCTILAGETVGSVNIPIINDPVIEAAELMHIDCSGSLTTGSTQGTSATITIPVDMADTEKMDVVWTSSTTKHTETDAASTVTLTAEFRDSNNNVAPVEDAITLAVTFPSAADTAMGAGMDYTAPAGTISVSASAMGVGTTSQLIEIVIAGDTTPENLELITPVLSESGGPAASIGVGLRSDMSASVLIVDNDKPELILIKNMVPIPRRAKKDVSMWAITNEGAGSPGITYSSLPHNYCDVRVKESSVMTTDVLTVIAARPVKNSRARFQEFTFTKMQMFAAMQQRTVHGFITPTSHTEPIAPIESLFSTLTVYPAGTTCLPTEQLDNPYTIALLFAGKWTRQLRWDFIPTGGTKTNLMKLKKYNGKCEIKLEGCNEVGLYIVSRRGRGKKGWQQYVRVMLAPCPRNMVGTPGACTAGTVVTCRNGGVFDQVTQLCTCPPGFAGQTCELALAPGTFGSNCDFSLEGLGFKDVNKRGKGVVFGLPEPFGNTCAAGYYGNDCTLECKQGLFFGANCLQLCNCVDSQCDIHSGYCKNGCKTGFLGANCQAKLN